MAVHDFTNIDILERYGRELTSDPLATGDKTYGRAVELDALARALAGHKSAVLLGPPGVGKTAILRKFLYYLKAGRLPHLTGTRLYEISTAGLCADTGYTGEMESKMRALLHRATPERAAYIADLWNLPTAGSYESNPRGIYDLLRPGIESGRLLLIGEMGEGRWERLCRKHPTLVRDFTTIEVRETDEEDDARDPGPPRPATSAPRPITSDSRRRPWTAPIRSRASSCRLCPFRARA